MRRSAGVLAAGLVILGLASVTACSKACETYQYSIAAGARGEPTATDSLTVWLRSAPNGFNSDSQTWTPTATGSANGTRTFSDGRGQIEVWQGNGNVTGYFVVAASTCTA